MPLTQENRLIAIDTPLGADVLLLEGFRGSEGISTLFHFDLSLFSEYHSIAFEDIIGENVTVSIDLADGGRRFFNGIISRFTQTRASGETGPNRRVSHYTASLVPTVWLLTKTTDIRIFQELSVPDIIEKIFREKEISNYALRLSDSYEPKPYCVQYRETDLDFISRLMEEEGIFYFFEHEDGNHTLVLADRPSEHIACPHQETARYELISGEPSDEDVVTHIEIKKEIRIGKYTLTDYNFETPSTNLKVEVDARQNLGPGDREIYDYPAEYYQRSAGDRLVNIRMQEEEAQVTTLSGTSNCRAFTSGCKFRLIDFFREELTDRDYVLTSLYHSATQSGYVTEPRGAGAQEEPPYSNRFSCIPHDIPFRPPRITPKPIVEGIHTAMVVGPAGEEIYTDEHGRVKVQFHWDRKGNRDDKSSCWIRVSQLWAGAGWGAMFIPRIGHEVIVDFLEGDPDRPVITGRLYHGNNRPPYSLPDDKTRSTLKSESSKGGGGFNELRFEDKKGSEEIYLHGQKDWTITILNDKNQSVGVNETMSVGNDRTKTVGKDQTETITHNKTIVVGVNHAETIGANMSLSVGVNQTELVGATSIETIGAVKMLTIGTGYQVSVGAAMNETVGGLRAEEVGGAKTVMVGGNQTLTVGGNLSESAGKNIVVQAGSQMALTAGGDFGAAAGKKGVIEAADQLTLKCGSASILLKKNGDITLQGSKISIKGSGDVLIKGSTIKGN